MMWLWILIGLNVSELKGFSDGNFPEVCDSMFPDHRGFENAVIPPQSSEPPFMISYQLGRRIEDPITVTLKSKDSRTFVGFMLEARNVNLGGKGPPVGKFISLNSQTTQLLRCNDLPDSAVSQRNDWDKVEFTVNWTAQGDDLDVIFRATFLQTYSEFWERVNVTLSRPTSTSVPSTTKPTTAATTVESTEPTITTESTEPTTTTESTEPTTTTESTEPPTTTESTEPTTTTESTEPTTTTESTEPTTTTESTEPTTTTESTEPTTTTESTEPTITTESTEPTTTTTESTEPTTTTESTEPTITTESTEPTTTTTESTEPTTTTESTEPTTTTESTEPTITTESTEPTTTTTESTEPTTTTESTEPTITTESTEPTTTTTESTEPTTTTESTEPTTTTESTEPTITTESTEPTTTTESTEPTITTESTEPTTTTTESTEPTTTTEPTEPTTNSTISNNTSLSYNINSKIVSISLMCLDSIIEEVKMEISNIILVLFANRPIYCNQNKVLLIVCSTLCVVNSAWSLFFFIIDNSFKVTYLYVALVSVVTMVNFIEWLSAMLPLGNSHELNDIFDLVLRVCFAVHHIFTTVLIFFGVISSLDESGGNRRDSWHLIVMIAFTAWILLVIVWNFALTAYKKILQSNRSGNSNGVQERVKTVAVRVLPAVSVILLIGTTAFSVAVSVGLFMTQKN